MLRRGLEKRQKLARMTSLTIERGCSSVVERHVANVNVVSSTLITRFWMTPVPNGAGVFCLGVEARAGSDAYEGAVAVEVIEQGPEEEDGKAGKGELPGGAEVGA